MPEPGEQAFKRQCVTPSASPRRVRVGTDKDNANASVDAGADISMCDVSPCDAQQAVVSRVEPCNLTAELSEQVEEMRSDDHQKEVMARARARLAEPVLRPWNMPQKPVVMDVSTQSVEAEAEPDLLVQELEQERAHNSELCDQLKEAYALRDTALRQLHEARQGGMEEMLQMTDQVKERYRELQADAASTMADMHRQAAEREAELLSKVT